MILMKTVSKGLIWKLRRIDALRRNPHAKPFHGSACKGPLLARLLGCGNGTRRPRGVIPSRTADAVRVRRTRGARFCGLRATHARELVLGPQAALVSFLPAVGARSGAVDRAQPRRGRYSLCPAFTRQGHSHGISVLRCGMQWSTKRTMRRPLFLVAVALLGCGRGIAPASSTGVERGRAAQPGARGNEIENDPPTPKNAPAPACLGQGPVHDSRQFPPEFFAFPPDACPRKFFEPPD